MYKGDDLLVVIDQWDWFILSETQLGVGKIECTNPVNKSLLATTVKDEGPTQITPSLIWNYADKDFHNKALRVIFEY